MRVGLFFAVSAGLETSKRAPCFFLDLSDDRFTGMYFLMPRFLTNTLSVNRS